MRAARAAVEWYLATHFGTADDPGLAASFCDPGRVGPFAVHPERLRAGDGRELFRLLIAVVMFQRRQDVQILRIQREMGAAAAAELTDAERLRALADDGTCDLARTTAALHERCDLTKDPVTRQGTCAANPGAACHLKRHTVAMKRYGHFGKVPTSAALVLREAGVRDLAELYARTLRDVRTREGRAAALEAALSRTWRIAEKIACMFLSAVTNPDLSRGLAPWTRGVDWTRFVVVDSNVDLFLASIGYQGRGTYEARRAFVRALAARIDLRAYDRRLHSYNPRLVQQAMYLFMSIANRRAAAGDCAHLGAAACRRCRPLLRERCPARR